MREIKFRGKRVNDCEWVYGDYHRRAGGVHCIIDMQPDWQGKVMYQLSQVDPDTVGQFTGWIDKNGEEIYEGDVLDVLYSIHVERENVCVVFGNNKVERTPGFYFSDNGTTECDHTWDFRDFLLDRKVIGNIHDNPELLNNH